MLSFHEQKFIPTDAIKKRLGVPDIPFFVTAKFSYTDPCNDELVYELTPSDPNKILQGFSFYRSDFIPIPPLPSYDVMSYLTEEEKRTIAIRIYTEQVTQIIEENREMMRDIINKKMKDEIDRIIVEL